MSSPRFRKLLMLSVSSCRTFNFCQQHRLQNLSEKHPRRSISFGRHNLCQSLVSYSQLIFVQQPACLHVWCVIRALLLLDERVPDDLNGPIEEDKPADQVRQAPLTLPAGFEWDTLDISEHSIVCIHGDQPIYD